MVAWLTDERAQARHHDSLRVRAGGKPSGAATRALGDSTIANVMKPVRSCLKSAKRERKIAHDPTEGLRLPKRTKIAQDDDESADVRAFTREQLGTILAVVHPKHRDLFTLLAATGLRISEALALEWRHLELELSPSVKVRQQHYRGRLEPPKTSAGRREVPLPPSLAKSLRLRRSQSEGPRDTDYVFANEAGKVLHVENLRRRFLRPATSEAGVPWASFHVFRHTFASLKLEAGAQPSEVAAQLGHASVRVTLDTYSHWLRRDNPTPLDLDAELGITAGVTQATGTGRNGGEAESREMALLQGKPD